MKNSKSIIAILALSLIFAGVSPMTANAADSGTQQKKQFRQQSSQAKQQRSMNQTGKAAGETSGDKLRTRQRIQDPSTH